MRFVTGIFFHNSAAICRPPKKLAFPAGMCYNFPEKRRLAFAALVSPVNRGFAAGNRYTACQRAEVSTKKEALYQ
jgi:hypothetical protein